MGPVQSDRKHVLIIVGFRFGSNTVETGLQGAIPIVKSRGRAGAKDDEMCPRQAARDALFLQEPMQIATLVNPINSRGRKKRQRGQNGEIARQGKKGM